MFRSTDYYAQWAKEKIESRREEKLGKFYRSGPEDSPGCAFSCAEASSNLGVVPEGMKLDGARQPSRYLLFHIPVVLEKKVCLVHNGKFAKGYEKVVVREVGVSSDSQRYSDEGVLARQGR